MKNIKQTTFNNVEFEKKIYNFAGLNTKQVLTLYKTDLNGYSESKAFNLLEENGPNIVKTKSNNTFFTRLLSSFINPFNLILFVIAIVTFITDVIISTKKDFLTFSIILILIIVASVISFIQGEKSSRETKKLTSLLSNTTRVRREGIDKEVPFTDIVVGDILQLSSGDMIPADVFFLKTKDTFVSQTVLTGESNPVEKFALPNNEHVSITDLNNIGYMGSNINSGICTALVIATGNDTYIGKMAKSLTGNKAKNSFEKGVESISKLLIKMMLIVIPLVFLVNAIIKKDVIQALLFAVSIAVGLTPELLPVVMSATLSKGATNMAKQKVIVRSLGSIQAFGQMNVLCTDKTGTLTEDKIVVEKYMNILGEDDDRVFRHGYLNSYFQTGLKNLIDKAIITRAIKKDISDVVNNYQLVDEIPFDFTRRRLSVVLVDKTNKRQLITKGAVDEIISACSYIEVHGQVRVLDQELKEKAYQTYYKYNNKGLRIIAIAQKNNVPDAHTFSPTDEAELVLIGFIGFLDPPKESAREALTVLKEHGVRTIILTGDSEGVTRNVANKLNLGQEVIISGLNLDKMSEEELDFALSHCNIFVKLTPLQKARIVERLQKQGNTVGYLGDGINDAPALREADIGIAVDSGVDLAKETADIILLEKDLMVLERGIIEGRKTFANIMKYIKMTVSGNFGNIISVLVASIFLPFLPLLPVHILTQNLLNDFAQLGIPFDNVDDDFIKIPRKWDSKDISKHMFTLGPLSSVFDILMMLILFFVYKNTDLTHAIVFQTAWFVFGTLSQIVITYSMRTNKTPFIRSKPSLKLVISTIFVMIITIVVGFTSFAKWLDMTKLNILYLPAIIGVLILYFSATQIVRIILQKRGKNWI